MPAPRFWQTATLHLDPPCPLPAINGGYCPSAGGERQGGIGMILPADAPALARPTCRLGFPSRLHWCRRAAPRAALASLPSPNSRFMRAGCDSRSGIGSSGPQMVGNENAGPACSCGHAGAHAHLPPFPLYYFADCLPAASNRGQLTSFARPPISPRISGALVAPRQRIKRHIPSLVAQERHVTSHFCASRAAQTSSQTRPRR